MLRYLFAFLMVLPICCIGCSEKLPKDMPKLHPATLTFTQGSDPLEGAIIQLIGETPDVAAWGPTGVTDSKGAVILQTNGKYKGAPVGKYKILVTKRTTEEHPHPEWANLPDGDPNFRKYVDESNKLKSFDMVEAKYRLLAETPLTVEIQAGQNAQQFDVGAKVQIESRGMR